MEKRDRPTYRTIQQDVSFHKAYDGAKNKSQVSKLAAGTGCRGGYLLAEKIPGFDRDTEVQPSSTHMTYYTSPSNIPPKHPALFAFCLKAF